MRDGQGVPVNVTTYQTRLRGKPVWVVAWSDGALRRRAYRKTKKDADTLAVSMRGQADKYGGAWLILRPQERAELMRVYGEISEAGRTLAEVWDGYRAALPAASGKPLADVVRECLADKRAAGLRPAYLEALEYSWSRFVRGREQMPIPQVGAKDATAWLDSECRSASVRASMQSRLSTLFSWCVQRKLRRDNPIDELHSIKVDQKAPIILTPAQVDSALAWVDGWPDFRAYLVLGLFCGIRPDELLRLTWASVDIARGLVTIDAATSKVRRRRIVPIAPRALALLSPKSVSGTSIWPNSWITLKPRRRALAQHLGIEWQADLLRHTAASYLMARDRDAGKVADMLGNSPGVLLTRYRELVSPEDAAKFWGSDCQ
jgi:integrase